ncbi:MAG: hypothetical protein MJZ92_01595 [Paludibacteraceae bacterium]|nr:hypothetical protein [Paludibacteraceae bacterium]
MLTAEQIRVAAISIGFDDCGIAPARYLEEDAPFMDYWISRRLHGDMAYLERNCDKRYDPRRLVPGAQTVVVCLLSFARSGHDYHRSVKSLLFQLETELKRIGGDDIVNPDAQHIFCDSAPILERRWATLAGLGFIGKNRQFIHPTLGSLVHPGELILNVAVEDTLPKPTFAGCGDCRKCLDACPRQALGNSEWDATRCIAYETHKCTICQLNCPYNETVK